MQENRYAPSFRCAARSAGRRVRSRRIRSYRRGVRPRPRRGVPRDSCGPNWPCLPTTRAPGRSRCFVSASSRIRRFRAAANTPALTAAFDSLVGPGRWLPRGGLGTFPIRFPSSEDPGDAGWHVDPSFGWENEPDFLSWRTNVQLAGTRALDALPILGRRRRGRADAGSEQVRTSTSRAVSRRTARPACRCVSLRTRGSPSQRTDPSESRVGPAGTVYLCHPFLVHAARPHRGRVPRFLAQPALLPSGSFDPMGVKGSFLPSKSDPPRYRREVSEGRRAGVAGDARADRRRSPTATAPSPELELLPARVTSTRAGSPVDDAALALRRRASSDRGRRELPVRATRRARDRGSRRRSSAWVNEGLRVG